MLLFTVAMNGCGKANPVEQTDEAEDNTADAINESEIEKEDDPEDFEDPGDSITEISGLKYIEFTEIEDSYDEKAIFKIYAPKGNSIENGFLYYYNHGLTFTGYAVNCGSNEYMLGYLESSVESQERVVSIPDLEYTDVEISDILENGNDMYQIITAKREDYYGTPYDANYICYLDVQGNGEGVLWELELSETEMDSETDLIIDELARCYGIDLDDIKAEGKWAVANERRSGKGEFITETILWFNATYAPLTYSNNCDWEMVGGVAPTENNKEFRKEMLSSGWGIEDRDSAIETVENLKKNGHREKCRECMKELKKLGILDEKNKKRVIQALMDSGIEENIYRYVLAYEMHQSGLEADYIAAWDLCRVNYLYADFYICGYMTFEEAMDASLENSLALQQMYSSWDEMAVAYLIGYQFWQSDPMTTDDSPTQKRYQCYLDLLEMEDGPYTLDWDTELQKSW